MVQLLKTFISEAFDTVPHTKYVVQMTQVRYTQSYFSAVLKFVSQKKITYIIGNVFLVTLVPRPLSVAYSVYDTVCEVLVLF